MDLINILSKILQTKNEIKSIIGENDNLSRYNVTIHNFLAGEFNKGYRAGYNERYFDLTGNDVWVEGPERFIQYTVDPKYYDSFTTEILTDISRDVLNYKLNIKDEIDNYAGLDIGLLFEMYPDYLRGIMEQAEEIGYAAGVDAADENYEYDGDVEIPTLTYGSNKIVLTSSQAEALIFYKLGADGIDRMYTGPVIISDSCDVYYYARIGRARSDISQHTYCEWDPDGLTAFVYAPVVNQDHYYIQITTATKNANIEYKVDDGPWTNYIGTFLIPEDTDYITARAYANNEYSKIVKQPVSHIFDEDLPENVRCYIDDNGEYRTITLTCATAGATIYYAFNDYDGYYREYTGPLTNSDTSFILYAYSVKDGLECKNRLVYRYTVTDDPNIPADVEFSDQRTALILYTTTSAAHICYRFGEAGDYITTSSNTVTLTPATSITVYAYSVKGQFTSRNITSYRFVVDADGNYGRPAKPTMTIDSNSVIHISSPYSVRYTINDTDPISNGIIYNPDKGIPITAFTTVRAVAEDNGKFSLEAVASFNPYYNGDWNGGGGPGGGGNNPGGGGSSDDPMLNSDYFWVTGITSMVCDKAFQYRIGENGQWMDSYNASLNNLAPTNTYFIRGNIGRVISFNGNAKIGGDVTSLVSYNNNNVLNIKGLFKNCGGITDAGLLKIPYQNIEKEGLAELFSGCSSMIYGPAQLFFTNVPEKGCYQMFKDCSNLKNGPVFNFKTVGINGCAEMFYGCNKLETAGNIDIENGSFLGSNAFNGMYRLCSSLRYTYFRLPRELSSIPSNACYQMYNECINLRWSGSTIDLGLRNIGNSMYNKMFMGCSSLEEFGNLPAMTATVSCYYGMFENCFKLQKFGAIHATALADTCMMRMFYGCNMLEYAPELPARNISGTSQPYSNMFEGCRNLHYIKAMFINDPRSGNWTGDWVKNVADRGTFVQNYDATWTTVGPNGIPEGWTVEKARETGMITDIRVINGQVYITASNSDDIYWSWTQDPDDDTSVMVKYDGPFDLQGDGYINACCKNGDGVFGSVLSVYCEMSMPGIVISCSNNIVTIYTPYDFTYDYFEYKLFEYQTDTVALDWTRGNEFPITQSYTVQARGWKNGSPSGVVTADIVYGINSPVINFNKGDSGVIYVSISYPDQNAEVELWYKINNLDMDTPENGTGWARYIGNPVKVNDYFSDDNPSVIVSAIAKVKKDGQWVWSSMTSRQYNRSGVDLPVPSLRQIEGTNNVILVIDDVEYPTWDNTAITIQYKYYQGGQPIKYEHVIDLTEYGQISSGYIEMYVRAKSGIPATDWNYFRAYFDNTIVEYNVNAPVIWVDEEENPGYGTLHITCDTVYQNQTTNLNYKLYVTEWTNETHTPSEDYHAEYAPFNYPFTLDNKIVSTYIYAQANVRYKYSEETSYFWTNPFAITSIPAPQIQISKVGNKWRLTVSNSKGYITDNIHVYAVDTQWAASGTVDEHKYDYPGITVGRYGVDLDQNLGRATFYAWYEYAGLTSDESEPYEFYDPDVVTVLWPPEITVARNDNLKLYVLTLQNRYNPGVNLQFRVTNPVWSGGVVDENKYADWKNCFLYGESLSEYLISGTIEARTYLNSEKISEVSTYNFSNTDFYEALGKPQINVIKDNNKAILTVTNKNKYAVNWFKITDTTWDPRATNTNKYNNYKVVQLYGVELDAYLLTGKIQAYSVWGAEISDVSEYDYNSGTVINSDPPTIEVEQNQDGETYTVTVTNNAWVQSGPQIYPRVFWHIINCIWDGEQTSTNTYVNDANDTDWKVMSFNAASGGVGTITINEHLLAGTIEAFATDATNNLWRMISTSNNTATTSIEWQADDYIENNED